MVTETIPEEEIEVEPDEAPDEEQPVDTRVPKDEEEDE